jgi:hypothetical protein
MRRKISIFAMLLALLLIEFPAEGFAGNSRSLPISVEVPEGTESASAASKPGRRRRRRRAWRNGRLVWISYAPSRRYRMARRNYYVGGIRRVRLVRVYY